MEGGAVSDSPHRHDTAGPFNPPTTPHRTLTLPSVLPYLRRSDTTIGRMTTPRKPPLLTLKLSSPSFLECSIHEEFTKDAFYTVATEAATTTITRAGPGGSTITTAQLKWPKTPPVKGKGKETDGILIQMGSARWRGGETLLRPGLFQSAPRKFNIPNYSQSMKWRKSGTSYWCTTAGVKGAIAVMEPSAGSTPARLKVYETLHDKYDARALDVHHGVSTLLLDYLIVTALLLVTNAQDFLVVKQIDDDESFSSPSINEPYKLVSVMRSTSTSQWRKILYGEPLFPKRSVHIRTPSTPEAVPPDAISPGLTSPDRVAKIAYGVPLYPSLRSLSPSSSSWDTDSEDEDDPRPVINIRKAASRPPSPSAESIFFPVGNASAPSHTYLDPSFYGDKHHKHLPPLPTPKAGIAALSRMPVSPTPSSSRQNLAPPSPRPRPIEVPASAPSPMPSTSSSLPATRRPSLASAKASRARSVVARPLPQPPATSGFPPSAYSVRFAQSQTTLVGLQKDKRDSNNQGARSLPPTPVRSNSGYADGPSVPPIRLGSPAGHFMSVSDDEIDRLVESLHLHHEQQHSPPPMIDTPPPAYNTLFKDIPHPPTASTSSLARSAESA